MTADAGPDVIVLLGQDFDLLGCGSSLDNQSICDLEAALFDIDWLLDDSASYIGHDIVITDVATGANSNLFTSIGEYLVRLDIAYTAENGQPLTSSDWMTVRIVVAAPASVGLVMGGVFYLFWRRRRL